jgi:hypothetical protein
VQPLEVGRVLEAAGSVVERELADLAVDPRLPSRVAAAGPDA